MTHGRQSHPERDSADAESFRRARDFLIENYSHPAAVASFDWPVADTFNWALDWFDRFADGNQCVAVAGPDLHGVWREVTYDELARASDGAAHRLRLAEVRAGDRVLIESESVCELWAALIGILKCGAVCIPTHFGLHPDQFDRRLATAGPRVLVTSADRAQSQAARIDLSELVRWGERIGFQPGPRRSADLPAFGCFTSGTTGTPKLALHSNRTHGIGHLSSLYWSQLGPGHRHLNVSSPGWAKFFWSSLLVPLTAGATVVPWPQHFAAANLYGYIEAANVDSVCAPIVVLRGIDTTRSRPSPLRDLTSVGEKVDDRTRTRFLRDWGVRIREGFGQTEATAILGEFPDSPGELRVLPGYRVRVHNDWRCPAPQLQFRSFPQGSFLGYEQDGALRGPVVSADGWQWTGDHASGSVQDGTLRLLGRGDDVYKSNGHLVSPFDIESILEAHPSVAEAAVAPVADAVLGQVSHAFVVIGEAGRTEDLAELREWLNQRLEPEVAVHRVHAVERLPRSVNGKIQRRRLVAGLGDDGANGSARGERSTAESTP
ncbi:AMP-binding protein [Nocardia asiatica]|uniref:AMP-binding protein n=1 Tax=Nocardia asiatica TaxID=209252 RepID=UPI003EE02512